MSRDVPLRRSLLVRLLAASALVAVCSIAATAWLVMSMTTAAIRSEQGRSLADDAKIYDTLVAYAAGHRDWRGAGATVRRLAHDTDRRIVVTTLRRAPIAASAPGSLARRASARIDPLDVDPDLGPDRIDRRARGPYRRRGGTPRVAAPAPKISRQRKALRALAVGTQRCLDRRHRRVQVDLSFDATGTPRSTTAGRDVARCFATARRRQLRPYVAAPALLFVSSPGGVAATSLDLSPAHRGRIIAIAALIFGLTLLATAIVGRRLVRPLRAVTRAAEQMKDGAPDVRVTVAGSDELGRLAEAFNAMAARREQLERQRTVMVSDVAHELRTPVSNIRGWLEAAQDGLATADPAFVASLLEEASLLHHLIDDLQDLSAAEAGELRLHPEPVRVVDVLDQVASAHRAQPGVPLVVKGDRALEVEADPVRLRQVVGNLVSNAIRHSRDGDAVTLHARRDGDYVAIEVADRGEGIAAAHLPHVFERFWRAEKSRNRRAGGSGLGLAIVRKVVEAHGGSVTAVSAPGAGAIFTVRLPRTSGISHMPGV